MSNNEFITTLDASNNYGKYQFKTDGSDFDGITAIAIPGYEPWNQLWDGLKDTEKAGMTLITKNTEIKKEIKDKTTGEPLPIKGVKFCQYLGTVTEDSPRQNTYDKKLPDGKTLKLDKQYCSEPTNEKGETWLQIDEMEYGESYLIEEYAPNQTFIGTTNEPIELKQPEEPTKIYVDLGVRFLGETDGADLISYQDLRKTLREGGKEIGTDLKLNENDGDNGKWLKIYDIRKNKVLYIAKKPLTNKVPWNQLCSAGVVFGLDQVSVDGTLQPQLKALKICGETYKPKIITKNNRKFIVRLLKTTKENKINKSLTTDWTTFKTKTIMGSEWNRYILPLVKDYRYGSETIGQLEESLKKGGQAGYLNDKNFDIQLSEYNWFGDLTLGTYSSLDDYKYYRGNITKEYGYYGQYSWMQEMTNDTTTRALRGYNATNGGAASIHGSYSVFSHSYGGFRPVLEEIPQNCYDGACFEGEVAGTDFITYKELLENIEGKPLEKLSKNPETNKPQTKVGVVLGLGEDEITGGNWLKTHDYKEGKTIYIAKKPLTNYVSWQDLYKAGVVFGLDQVDKDTMKLKTQPQIPEYKKNSSDKTGKNLSDYKATKIEINGKPYIVRLLKGINTEYTNTPSEIVTQGSEWNRYILPLVKDYRYGKDSSNDIEQALKDGGQQGKLGDSKKFKIQLTKYNWFEDLTLYEGAIDWVRCGQNSWVQEYIVHSEYERNIVNQFYRGSYGNYLGGAYLDAYDLNVVDSRMGFRPALEEIPE